MASGGRDLSSRMCKDNYELMCEIAVKYFKEHKVEISDAIKASYPFLETLRDCELITNEMYKEIKQSCEDPSTVPKVLYGVLDKMKGKHILQLLEILFSKVMMKNYPDLNDICEGFRHEILKKMVCQASVGDESAENRNTQLRIEQGTGGKSYPSLSWLFPDQSNYTGTGRPDNKLSECLSKTEDINEMDASTIRDNNALETEQAIEQCAQEFESVVTISDDSARREGGEEPPKASTPAVKRKTGTTTKCITKKEMCSFTLSEFEVKGGYKASDDWRKSLHCGGRTLEDLMKDGTLPTPPEKDCTNKEGKDSDKCKICRDGGKLFHCETCQSFFHGDCHLPPVLRKRVNWRCTFCKVNDLPRNEQRYTESKVLEKAIGHEQKMLKCQFLLLQVYDHLEGNVFPNIPCENYAKEASRCLKKLRKLDKIKESLLKENYPSVESFVQAMYKLFPIPSCNDAKLTLDDFKKNFKQIFAIQETN